MPSDDTAGSHNGNGRKRFLASQTEYVERQDAVLSCLPDHASISGQLPRRSREDTLFDTVSNTGGQGKVRAPDPT